MPNLEMARAEIKRVDTILRSRYNYAHPVFDHLAAALEALEGDLPEVAKSRRGKAKRASKAEAPVEPAPEPEAEAEAAVVVEEEAEVSEEAGYEQ